MTTDDPRSDRDSRTWIQRLLNYKRYIDFLIEKELERADAAANRN